MRLRPKISARLTSIVGTLRAAAGPDVPIVGGTYHDPLLAAWTFPGFDHDAVVAIADVWTAFNDMLEQTYASLGVPVADIEGAFSATDFDTIVHLRGVGDVPINVARACQWTYACSKAAGYDFHPNTIGYAAMTRAWELALDTVLGAVLPCRRPARACPRRPAVYCAHRSPNGRIRRAPRVPMVRPRSPRPAAPTGKGMPIPNRTNDRTEPALRIAIVAVTAVLTLGSVPSEAGASAGVAPDGSLPADEVVAMLRSGTPVDLRGVTIVGDLDLRPVGTVTEPVRCRDCALDGSLTATDVVFERLVDLGGIRVAGDVDVGGAVFGDALLLEGAQVGGDHLGARLARFGGPASFDRASMAGSADFTGARFLASASFAGTDFGASAAFDLATFAEDVVFTAADEGAGPGAGACADSAGAFRGDAGFARSRFGGNADFGSRCFGGETRFASATFGGITDFALTRFEATATFDESTFAQPASFRVSAFEAPASFVGVRSQSSMDFRGTRFFGGAILFGLSSSGTLDLTSVGFAEGQRIDLTEVSAGRLLMDVGIVGQIIGQGVQYEMLRRLEESARASGDIPLANDARFTLLSLQHEERSGIARLFDAGYRTIGGYLVRPSYPLRALLWLLVIATVLRALAWAWSMRPSRGLDGDRRPAKTAAASARERARSRVLGWQRLVTTILRKATESIGVAFRKAPKITVENEESVWSYFHAAGRWAEFLSYKLLLALFLLALANSNATARQIVDSIRG